LIVEATLEARARICLIALAKPVAEFLDL
jgi:hypothetical protein